MFANIRFALIFGGGSKLLKPVGLILALPCAATFRRAEGLRGLQLSCIARWEQAGYSCRR